MKLAGIITNQHSNCFAQNLLPKILFSDNLLVYQPSPVSSLTELITPTLTHIASDSFNPPTPQFIHRCSPSKILQQRANLESEIQIIQNQLKSKEKIIQHLLQQIKQLKVQQQYLLHTIQTMRDRQNIETLNRISKLEKFNKQKQEQLKFANKQLQKLKEWLKQEKSQVYKMMECLKMKDIVIENLQNELEQAKKNLIPKKKTKRISIDNQNETTDQLAKYKIKSLELQEQIYDLTQYIDTLRHENINIKQQLKHSFISNQQRQSIRSEKQQQLCTPIQKLVGQRYLKQKRTKSIYQYNNQLTKIVQQKKSILNQTCSSSQHKNQSNLKFKCRENREKQYELLNIKCYRLQLEIQKLMTLLQKEKMENDKSKNNKFFMQKDKLIQSFTANLSITNKQI